MEINAVSSYPVEGLPGLEENEYFSNELDLFCKQVIFLHFYDIDLHKNCLTSLDIKKQVE